MKNDETEARSRWGDTNACCEHEKKINKRFLIALLAFTLPFGCVGCSDGGSSTTFGKS